MDFEKAREDFAKLQKRVAAMNHAMDLIFFDAETSAPPKSSSNRIINLEILNEELYSIKFGQEMADVMACLEENEDALNLIEKRSLKIIKREWDRMKSMPKEEYVKYQSVVASAQDAWHRANEENDYEILRPYLEEIFDRVRDIAMSANPGDNPYNYCLDTYEPGSNVDMYDTFFDGVRRDIVPLLRQISEMPPVDDRCLKGDYSAAKQESLALYIMNLMGVDMTRVSLATSEHPFTRCMGSHFDQRLTTKYFRKDFTFSLYTVLFECGYALAELGQDDEIAYTFADSSASIGLMEGQTRFYENIIGRSRPFIECIYPKLKSLFPTSIRNATTEELYMALNKINVRPTRMGSDEVSNNLHVLVRYELEKALMNKELSFKELPDAWAEKYMEYLGVEINHHNQGVLQDILWSEAAIGYFPTAVLGNSYSAIMLEKMSEDINIKDCVRKGDMAQINQWNRDHVWKHMGLHDARTVMKDFVGATSMDSGAYIKYLKNKYSDIYNL